MKICRIDSRIEMAKIVVIREAPKRESVSQSTSSEKEAK